MFLNVVINTSSLVRPALTCWTCPDKTDNDACNDWAPNVPCSLRGMFHYSINLLLYKTKS